MADRTKALTINGFRGATQPLDMTFDASKPVVLIFGENGTGKSTIVDAIESVTTGTASYQDDWKLGKGKRKESYIPALGKALADVRINIEFGSNTYSVQLSNKGLIPCNTENRPMAKVLRRKSLQAFMDADPAQRYKEVAAFLDIPQIEAAELSLREALKEAQRKYEISVSALSQAQENLQGLWEAEGSPGMKQKQNAEDWGRQQAATPTEALQAKLQEQKTGLQHIQQLRAKADEVAQAEEAVNQAQQALTAAEEHIAQVESGDGKSSAELVTLLQDAKIYLTKSPDALCPVCEETTIVAAELAARLQIRIDSMNALKDASEAKTRADKTLNSRNDQLNQAQQVLCATAQSGADHFGPKIPELPLVLPLDQHDPQPAVDAANNLLAALTSVEGALESGAEDTQKQLNNLNSIRQYIKTLDDKTVEARQGEAATERLKRAVAIFEAKRKAYVDGILAGIAQEVDRLYQQIHPAEEIGGIKLKLDDNQRGSLIYGVAFGGQQEIPPQPYYSESHLDTLGLCIFLALAMRGDSGRTLVVLDDVLGSVDQQHLQKTIGMLLQESTRFAQVIITTHYRPLRDQFRYARQPATPLQVIELKPWNFMHGIKTGETLTYADDLRQQLQQSDFRREAVASQAGMLFESLLEFLSTTYRCKVPHLIEPRYTFGDLASAPNGKLKQALRVVKQGAEGTEETTLAPLYDQLTNAMHIRNLVGCHFNQWAGELSDQEVREMAELALTLADTLICNHCGGLPVSNKSGSYWECSCKQTQMHPLQQPQ